MEPNTEVTQSPAEVEKTETKPKGRWSVNVVKDESAPMYYSERAIYMFSVFFSTLAGGILLAYNLRKTHIKKAWAVFGASFAYCLVEVYILNHLKNGTSTLSLMFSFIGAFLLYEFGWKPYIGADTKYRARPIWRPLIIWILVSAIILSVLFTNGVTQ